MPDCAHCGAPVTDRDATYCSISCANRARSATTAPAAERPTHGHRWLPDMRLDADGLTYCWRCDRCGDELDADPGTEAFLYPCEAQSEAAA